MPEHQIFLLPGEMHFAREPSRITTLLGSCVGVVLHDAAKGWGGMNHFMLPDASSGRLAPGKCGDQSCAMLLKLAAMAGSRPADLAAMVIGGGRVTGHLASSEVAGLGDVGDRNVAMARKCLAAAGIRVVRQEVGGTLGRKLHFQTLGGHLDVRPIPASVESAAASSKAAELRQRKARVLIVDDSATVRSLIARSIGDDPDLEVVGEAEDPFAAREQMLAHDPDVICLDIIMPKLDGLSFLKRLMAYKPVPTVVISTIAKAGSEMQRKLTEAGAVAVIDKEELKIYAGLDTCRARLLPVLRRAAVTAVQRTG